MPERPYTYFDYTMSLCPVCLKKIDAKIIFQDGKVYMTKKCQEHGSWKILLSTDIEYYKFSRNFVKQSEMPYKFAKQVEKGCPYDCGLCTDHEQHSCLTILEITETCNLTCPTCYANSAVGKGKHRTLQEIESMLDMIVAAEKEPDVLQISGGEPTLHPEFFTILSMLKESPVKHTMLNTNGIKIANDRAFAEKLAAFSPGFEVYLQFDSFDPATLIKMRGKDLTKVRERAIATLNELNLSTTLVVTLEKDSNAEEIGQILEYAIRQKCVRGVTFQPTQVAGRNDNFSYEHSKITLSEVRNAIVSQSGLFTEKDIIPVPCNPDALAMGYALKLDGEVLPLTRYIDPGKLLLNSENSISFEKNERIREDLLQIFSTGTSPESQENRLQSLLCCLPSLEAPKLKYDNLFRVIIMNFMDAYDFDVRSVKKSCVHIATTDGRLIPFETMNLLYRDA
ncbi:MAG: radical SAM protein [Spirochaetota bacterium]